MSREDAIKMLAADGKLVKRPILVKHGKAVTGFKAEEWEELIGAK